MSRDVIELSPDLVPSGDRNLFALRVRGHSMVDALINDGDVVILKVQEDVRKTAIPSRSGLRMRRRRR